MAEEQANNVAPAVDQSAESVATPNTNDNAAQDTGEKAPESVTPYFDKMSEDDRKSLDSFLANNGGMKAFNKWKESVSNPEPKKEEQQTEQKQEPAQQPEQQQQEPQQQQQPLPKKGTITPGEFLTQQYFNALAGEEKYKEISQDITSGNVFKEMAGFGINPVNEDGSLNDAVVRRFLDLKAKTIPPKAPAGEAASATPTVDYVKVGDKITSKEEAMKVLSQPGHERHDDALKFLAQDVLGTPAAQK